MKNIFNLFLFAAGLSALVVACKKEETKIYFEGGTAPVLSSTVTGTIPLPFAMASAPAITLRWTNPNYNFTTGVSSHNVSYNLQFDIVGANFTSPSRQEISIPRNLDTTLTVAEVNGLLTKMGLASDMPHNIETRVVASINGAVPLTSNVLQFTNVIPYEDFALLPPASNELFIVGSATPGGWNNPVPVPGQKLTTIKKGLYEITLPITGGGSYLFLPVNGSWDDKYGGAGANNANNPTEDLVKRGGGDLLAPSASGTYKITVDFKTGKFKLTKL